MPTYSYECDQCAHVTTVFHGINATPSVSCGECGGPTHRLLGTGAGLIFKGSGFYETDYKRSGSNGSNGSNGAAKTEGASESKAEPKSESKASTTAASSGGSSSGD